MDDIFNIQLSPNIPIMVELTKENQELLRELINEIRELRGVIKNGNIASVE